DLTAACDPVDTAAQVCARPDAGIAATAKTVGCLTRCRRSHQLALSKVTIWIFGWYQKCFSIEEQFVEPVPSGDSDDHDGEFANPYLTPDLLPTEHGETGSGESTL